ncbi:13074_t:CDS:2, partial [Racocetra fulgida]
LWLRRSTPLPEGEDENAEETNENEAEKSRVTAPIQEDKKASYKSKEEILIEQIPNIHEKLVELFKLGFTELVHAEVLSYFTIFDSLT